jgi:hypothetical protein
MAKTLTTLRKELDLTDAANVRAIMAMFAKISESNPDAVKATFNKYMKSKSDAMQTTQVEFYSDMAKYLMELFDLD